VGTGKFWRDPAPTARKLVVSTHGVGAMAISVPS